MKLATFRKGEEERIGVVVGESLVDLKEADGGRHGGMFDDMMSFLESGEAGLERARELADAGERGKAAKIALKEVTLWAPVPRPGKLFCLAGNYVKHIEEGSGGVKAKDKITPRLFLKPSGNTVIGPGAAILLPDVARGVDWEAELAVVIGKKGKHIPKAEAYDYVAGYTAMNDVSERKLRIRERPETSEWDGFFDWLNGKWFDCFAPMGPYLVTADEIGDPHDLDLSLSVNGEQKQHSNTSHMIHRVDELIEYISAFITLEPGDMIATGTPEGTGDPVGVYLNPGDVVRVEIEKIGVLENRVEKERR